MINNCPHCGHGLPYALKDGLTHCPHCNRVFDSSDFNRLIAASWLVRRERASMERLQHQVGLSEDEAILVYTFVGEYCYSHEDFCKFLTKLGVANKSYISYC